MLRGQNLPGVHHHFLIFASVLRLDVDASFVTGLHVHHALCVGPVASSRFRIRAGEQLAVTINSIDTSHIFHQTAHPRMAPRDIPSKLVKEAGPRVAKSAGRGVAVSLATRAVATRTRPGAKDVAGAVRDNIASSAKAAVKAEAKAAAIGKARTAVAELNRRRRKNRRGSRRRIKSSNMLHASNSNTKQCLEQNFTALAPRVNVNCRSAAWGANEGGYRLYRLGSLLG